MTSVFAKLRVDLLPNKTTGSCRCFAIVGNASTTLDTPAKLADSLRSLQPRCLSGAQGTLLATTFVRYFY